VGTWELSDTRQSWNAGQRANVHVVGCFEAKWYTDFGWHRAFEPLMRGREGGKERGMMEGYIQLLADKLQPCPFCACTREYIAQHAREEHDPKLWTWDRYRTFLEREPVGGSWIIRCENCGIVVGGWWVKPEDAVKVWNDRRVLAVEMVEPSEGK
jgi:hypothetical protein